MKVEKIISSKFGSNSSVLNLSLNISNNIQNNNDNFSDSCSNSSFDIPKSLSKNIVLKEEREDSDSNISNYECFQIEENNSDITRKRSRTNYIPRCLINNAPKIKPKECNEELISPLTLCIKTFYQEYSCQKKTYSILNDFQKEIIDSKSCNDNINIDNDDLFSDDTERTTPNINDLNNFSICRKKMKNIIISSNMKSSYEYENILNSESIFLPLCENEDKIYNSNKTKKNNFWHKHIIKQKLKSMEINNEKYFDKNMDDLTLIKSKTFNLDEQKVIDTQGLFILGVLESAANEKRKRVTTGKCC